ncbi:hypothetical protein MRX96_056349 [Rhipicephalus microplus]
MFEGQLWFSVSLDFRRKVSICFEFNVNVLNNAQEGVVGPNLKIRPLETGERSEDGLQAHLVDNIEDYDSVKVYGKHIADEIAISERAADQRTGFDPSKYHVQDMFAEVLLICDSRLQTQFTGKISLTVYMMITMQVYTQEHEYYVYYGQGIDGYQSLQKLVLYVGNHSEKYEGIDLVYFATGFDMAAVYADGTAMKELQGEKSS